LRYAEISSSGFFSDFLIEAFSHNYLTDKKTRLTIKNQNNSLYNIACKAYTPHYFVIIKLLTAQSSLPLWQNLILQTFKTPSWGSTLF
ncbi:hypothetical protein, partial [Escherichia coli]|uniref:hypothetical protein n=1 Tax=Escherichia coli TaxID=562 RepID=UPI003EE43913